MIKITDDITLSESEVELKAIRSQGAGGQNVNKVSSAIHLRFDIKQSSLPNEIKETLLSYQDERITKDGVIIIKAQRFRTQQQNKDDAIMRLRALIKKATLKPKLRKNTQPSKATKEKRLEKKRKHSQAKASRRKDYRDEY